MSDAMREAFEAWWRDYNASIGVELSDHYAFERDEDGDYELMSTQHAWTGWQAALEHSGREVEPAGFVSQEFLYAKWSLDHIAKTSEGQLHRTIPVYTQPPAPAVPKALDVVLDMRSDLREFAEREGGLWRHFYDRICKAVDAMLAATPEPPK